MRNLESDLKQLNLVNRVDIVSAIASVTTTRSESTEVAEEETARTKNVKYIGLDPSASGSTSESTSASTTTTTNTQVYHVRRDENVWRWSAIKRNNFTASGVAEDKKLDLIFNYFKESALTTLIKYQKKYAENKTKQKIEEFVEILLKKEKVRVREEAKKLELTSLRQTGKIEDYISKFQEIGGQTDFKGNHNVVNLFITGEKSKSDLLTIDGLINGKSTHCIYDVGATNSVISFKAAKGRNIKIDESRGERVTIVNNEIVEAIGKTEELEKLPKIDRKFESNQDEEKQTKQRKRSKR